MEVREPGASYLPITLLETEVGPTPLDWSIVRLDEITDPERPISYGIVQTGPRVQNGVPCLRVVDIQDGKVQLDDLITTSKEISNAYRRTKLREGDLVVPLRGKVGECAQVGKSLADANLTRGVALVSVLPKYSASFCKQFFSSSRSRARLIGSMNGSALQEVPIASLRSFKIALPPTQDEQNAIADALTDADALIDSLEQLLTKKRQVKQGAMQELLSGKRRLPGFERPWISRSFADVATFSRERANPSALNTPPLCVELDSLESSTGRLSGDAFESNQAAAKSVFRRGDVLFGKLRAYLRKYWLAEFDGVCSTEIWVLRSRVELRSNVYLFYTVQRDDFIEAASTAYGTHMPRSDWKIVSEFDLALPSDATEQGAIAQVLADMDAEITALESRLTKARALKQAMAQVLLTGRIRLVEHAA